MIPKFRAWDPLNKIMITNFYRSYVHTERGRFSYKLATVNGNEIKATAYVNTLESLIYKYSHDLILMQSTEFKDNSDTEVFEGDIINVNWFYADFDPVELGAFENEEYAERVIVKKEFGNFGFWWEEADSWVDLATLAMSSRLDEESFEILGNIYENAELLKGANK